MNISPTVTHAFKVFVTGFISGATAVLTGASVSQSVDTSQIQVGAVNYKTVLITGLVTGIVAVNNLLKDKPEQATPPKKD